MAAVPHSNQVESSPSTLSERCPCGCGIFSSHPDWYERHYKDGFCKLCGRAAISSTLGRLTLESGEEILCPLCNLMIVESQLDRHAEMLVAERLKREEMRLALEQGAPTKELLDYKQPDNCTCSANTPAGSAHSPDCLAWRDASGRNRFGHIPSD